MTIDRIKISQEVNFMGMPTWIGMEAALLPEDNEKEGLRKLQKSITEYLQEEEKAIKGDKWKPQEATGDIDNEFEAVKAHLEGIEFQEDALEYLKTTSFHLSIEAKLIANLKPSKNK